MVLYLIEFLHQTTTCLSVLSIECELYLIEFLHQTTTEGLLLLQRQRCILLSFYIKPQRMSSTTKTLNVVSYWVSTSNHNDREVLYAPPVVVSYWVSTSNHNLTGLLLILREVVAYRGSASDHKQPKRAEDPRPVVSYWVSTSNHNRTDVEGVRSGLYLIEFLHQTTTLKP